MIKEVENLVCKIMDGNNNGHGNDHIKRVYNLAVKFAKNEGADLTIVSLAALLHDVDDYKIVGAEQAIKLTNTKNIMKKVNVDENVQKKVIDIISTMGYNKLLKGIRPTTLEGAVVSDADMCDAIGATGIIRSIIYAISDKGNGRIFDEHIYPNVNISSLKYNINTTTHETDGAINHFFEKLLKLKTLMLTKSGQEEATTRHNFMVSFLRQLFIEENAEEWNLFLDEYLEKENQKVL